MLTIPASWKEIPFSDVKPGDVVCIHQTWLGSQTIAHQTGTVIKTEDKFAYLGTPDINYANYAVSTPLARCTVYLVSRPPTTRKLPLKDLLTLPLKSKISFTTRLGVKVSGTLLFRGESVEEGWTIGYLTPDETYITYIQTKSIDPDTLQEEVLS